MDDLIEALNLVRPYMDDYGLKYPTGSEHDVLWLNVSVGELPQDVLNRLEELSFTIDSEYAGSLCSYRFGSC